MSKASHIRCEAYAIKMRKQAKALNNLGYRFNLGAMHALESFVLYLSSHLRNRGEQLVEAASQCDCAANFQDLTDYLD